MPSSAAPRTLQLRPHLCSASSLSQAALFVMLPLMTLCASCSSPDARMLTFQRWNNGYRHILGKASTCLLSMGLSRLLKTNLHKLLQKGQHAFQPPASHTAQPASRVARAKQARGCSICGGCSLHDRCTQVAYMRISCSKRLATYAGAAASGVGEG